MGVKVAPLSPARNVAINCPSFSLNLTEKLSSSLMCLEADFDFVKSAKTEGNSICSQSSRSGCLLGKSVGIVKKYNLLYNSTVWRKRFRHRKYNIFDSDRRTASSCRESATDLR